MEIIANKTSSEGSILPRKGLVLVPHKLAQFMSSDLDYLPLPADDRPLGKVESMC
jgi:hypothetical protein